MLIVKSQEQLNGLIDGRLGQLDTISGSIKLPNPCNESVLQISFGTKKRPAYIAYNCGYRIEVVGNSYAEAALGSEVIARDCSTVIARGTAFIEARDSSTVIALEESHVKAYDNAVVNAYASSRIEVYNNNLVSLFEGAKVTHHRR